MPRSPRRVYRLLLGKRSDGSLKSLCWIRLHHTERHTRVVHFVCSPRRGGLVPLPALAAAMATSAAKAAATTAEPAASATVTATAFAAIAAAASAALGSARLP